MAILVTSLPNALNDRYIDEDERCNDESEPLVALRRPSSSLPGIRIYNELSSLNCYRAIFFAKTLRLVTAVGGKCAAGAACYPPTH